MSTTLLAVKHAALLLIEVNGSVTTLEIKNLLRELDTQVMQSEVSELLIQAANELPLSFTTLPGKNHRTYTLPSLANIVNSKPKTLLDMITAPVVDTNHPQQVLIKSNVNTIHTHTKRNNQQVTLLVSPTDGGAFWALNCGDVSNKPTAYVDATYNSRDDARVAYSKHYKVSYNNVRGKIVHS